MLKRPNSHGGDNQVWSPNEVNAAQKYLDVHKRRTFIEQESGSRLDALPYRLIEIICANKLIRVAGFEFEENQIKDDVLPQMASLIVGDTIEQRIIILNEEQ